MAIFVNADTKVLVQGLTGGQGKYHGLRNRAYGTQVVAGVTPGKGGADVEGIPVFDTVAAAVAATGADASFVAVPPKAAPAAILEAAAAGIAFIVCITEGIPAQDEAKVFNTLLRDHPGIKDKLLQAFRASFAWSEAHLPEIADEFVKRYPGDKEALLASARYPRIEFTLTEAERKLADAEMDMMVEVGWIPRKVPVASLFAA